jgi:succinate dehydrogenase/fumarate reductase cytochrome b subunit
MSAKRIFGFLALMLWCLNITALGDVVTEWNLAALNAIRAQDTPPTAASRHLAILHAAVYDAVNGIRRTHMPFRITGKVPASASVESAAVAAGRAVLVNFYPMLQPSLDELQSRLLAGIPDGPQKVRGFRWGETVAAAILQWRSSDGPAASRGNGGLPCRLEESFDPHWCHTGASDTLCRGRRIAVSPTASAGSRQHQLRGGSQQGESCGRRGQYVAHCGTDRDREILGIWAVLRGGTGERPEPYLRRHPLPVSHLQAWSLCPRPPWARARLQAASSWPRFQLSSSSAISSKDCSFLPAAA